MFSVANVITLLATSMLVSDKGIIALKIICFDWFSDVFISECNYII
jgi:hypothetical protein